ncbi:histone-lysine N-methyltransferase SETMAR [Trichonephila clavipes]|nr:histone-lysine N-methyltransferase SETMAR [Trichonephila clavipes]
MQTYNGTVDPDDVVMSKIYKFDKKSTTIAICRNACQVYGDDAIDESTCHLWFRKFREGDRSFQDQTGSRRPSHVGDDEIDQAIRNNSNPTMQELSEISMYTGQWLRDGWLI